MAKLVPMAGSDRRDLFAGHPVCPHPDERVEQPAVVNTTHPVSSPALRVPPCIIHSVSGALRIEEVHQARECQKAEK